jgi:hypothetical protein
MCGWMVCRCVDGWRVLDAQSERTTYSTHYSFMFYIDLAPAPLEIRLPLQAHDGTTSPGRPRKALLNFTECSLNVHWMFTECSLNVHWIFTECSLNVHWMFTECSLNVLWMFTECSLNVHSMFTQCSLNVHWMFTQCSLNVHWMFTKCSLNVH